jgi:ComF family protein
MVLSLNALYGVHSILDHYAADSNRKTNILSRFAEGLVALFYPNLCASCRRPLVNSEQVLCLTCEQLLPETGYHHIPHNETAVRFSGRVPFVYATSFAWFTSEGLLQALMHQLKYQNGKQIGYYLGGLLGKRLMEAGWAKAVDVIVPVPLHPDKEAARGYNQSLLICKGLSAATGVPINSNLLTRTRNTASQTNKTRGERVVNVEGAFAVALADIRLDVHVLLVDDVLTTGATLEACALELRHAGITKISIATIGIAAS